MTANVRNPAIAIIKQIYLKDKPGLIAFLIESINNVLDTNIEKIEIMIEALTELLTLIKVKEDVSLGADRESFLSIITRSLSHTVEGVRKLAFEFLNKPFVLDNSIQRILIENINHTDQSISRDTLRYLSTKIFLRFPCG